MAGQTKEKSVCNGEDMFTMQEVRDERKLTRIRNLPVDQIVDFPDHPYRVRRTIRGEVLDVDEDVAVIMMCDSNLHRSVILPSEKAFAYKMRLEAMNRQGMRSDLTWAPVERSCGHVKNWLTYVGESREQIRRYIRLTNLIPQLLDMVDEGRLPMRTAVNISYLPENLQEDLYACIKKEAHIPSHSQVVKMRRLLQQEKLTKVC